MRLGKLKIKRRKKKGGVSVQWKTSRVIQVTDVLK